MLKQTKTGLKRLMILCALVVALLLVIRVTLAGRGPSLAWWHTWAPDELSLRAMDRADWQAWIRNENRIFAEVEARATQKLSDEPPGAYNRYAADSPVYPGSFARDWNRSHVLMPQGAPGVRWYCCMA